MNAFRTSSSRVARAAIFFVLTMALLAGCGSEAELSVDNGVVATTLVLPEQLRQVRALTDPQLEIRINGESVPVSQDPDSQLWNSNFRVNLGEQHHIQLRWSEPSANLPPLELIRAEEWFSTATTDPVSLVFLSDQFDSSSDADGDGRSNLSELLRDTNPRDANDPSDPLQEIILNVELPKPDELAEQSAIRDENLIVRATLNNGPLPGGFREDLNWFGQDTVAAGLPAFVTVEWCYRLSSGSLYRLLRFARSVQIGNANTFLESADVDYRSDYDLDADGVSNIREIAEGTQPDSVEQSSACL